MVGGGGGWEERQEEKNEKRFEGFFLDFAFPNMRFSLFMDMCEIFHTALWLCFCSGFS